MIRKPSSGSGAPSRPDSPMSSSSSGSGSRSGSGSLSGGSAAGKSGTRAGTSAGTRAGSVAGVRGTAAPAVAEPVMATGALAAAPPPKASPMLIGLAVAGWATFAVEWVVVLAIIIGRGDTTPASAAAPASTPSVATATERPAATTTPSRPAAPAAPAPSRPTTTQPAAPAPTPAVDSDNPFRIPRANVFGQPLPSGHTAVLLDAIEISSPWLTDVKAALLSGLTRPAPGNPTISLIYSQDGSATRYENGPFTPASGRLSALSSFLGPVNASGKGGLGDALDTAVATGADDIFFITSRATGWGGYLGTVRTKLETDGRMARLHVIQIGETNDDLRAFVQGANGGSYTSLTAEQINRWRRAAQ